MTEENNEHDDQLAPQGAPVSPTTTDIGRLPNGRYSEGFSGNPKGRPKKMERAWSNRQLITDVLLEANAEIPVTRNGKTQLVTMRNLIIRQLLIKAAKSDNLRQIVTALKFIDGAQSNREARDWEFYKDLEKVELLFEEECHFFSEASALERRDKWRKRSRKT